VVLPLLHGLEGSAAGDDLVGQVALMALIAIVHLIALLTAFVYMGVSTGCWRDGSRKDNTPKPNMLIVVVVEVYR
jgi:hypothetical protein